MAANYKLAIYVYVLLAVLTVQGYIIKPNKPRIASCTNYEYGKNYKYTYDTEILFNDQLSPKNTGPKQDVGLRLTVEFDFVPVYQSSEAQLIKLQVTSATLASGHRSGMEGQLLDMQKFPVYVEYMGGVVGRIFAIEGDSAFCVNVKKGILSLFQVQTAEGTREELDVSGYCAAVYKNSGPTIVKQKKDCQNLEIAGQHLHTDGVFGVVSESSATLTYQMENGIIRSVMGSNKHVASLSVRSSLNVMVIATQKLTYLSAGAMQEADKLPASSFDDATEKLKSGSNYPIAEMLLPSTPENQQCEPNECKKPQELIRELNTNLTEEYMATTVVAKAFMKMLKAFRNSGKEAISETMAGPDAAYVISQLIDVAVATQTPASQRALMELINFEGADNTVYPLRYLLAVAYSTHPGDYLIRDLLKLLTSRLASPQVREGVALALGSTVFTFCKDETDCQNQVVQDYITTILDLYKKCPEESCRLTYLRSMGNSGRPQFLSTILGAVSERTSTAMSGFTAAQALRRMPLGDLAKETTSLLKIFHQTERKFDSSVRAAVAELLLEKLPSKILVQNIFLSTVGDQRQFELSTFIQRKIVDMVKYNEELRSVIEDILSERKINNYYSWAQKGKSSAFSSLLAGTLDANSTYGLYMEMAGSGVMKKSFMDVNVMNKDSLQRLLSFGIYTAGLETLVGEEVSPEDKDIEATAGLALRIMDVLLPPVQFFQGSSGLMAAVWNAPTEPVSALAVNILLIDHSERVHLSNGLVVDLQVLGVASIDLTGQVSISLWNRNSESLIRNSGTLVVEGSMKLVSEIGRVGTVFTAESQAFIDFATDVDFYETPFKMCMQMKRPKIAFKHTLEKYEKATKFDRSYKSRVRKISYIDGLSYFLSQKNSEECKKLLANK